MFIHNWFHPCGIFSPILFSVYISLLIFLTYSCSFSCFNSLCVFSQRTELKSLQKSTGRIYGYRRLPHTYFSSQSKIYYVAQSAASPPRLKYPSCVTVNMELCALNGKLRTRRKREREASRKYIRHRDWISSNTRC